jgi:catechol 2,3-dioxygenase-like lactoylglutathione lyase family enzyme
MSKRGSRRAAAVRSSWRRTRYDDAWPRRLDIYISRRGITRRASASTRGISGFISTRYFPAATSPRRRARGDEPAATILRSPGGLQLFLEGGNTEKLPPWFHFGFFVESMDACRDLYERMQHDHVTIVHPFVTEPFAYYFFADPDGHVIQVYFDPKAR